MKLSTSTNMVFERIGMEPISQEKGILLCAEAGYRIFDFCFHDLITYESPFLDERWEAYTEKMCALFAKRGLSCGQAHANVYDFLNPKADHAFHQRIMERCVLASERMQIPWLVVHPSTDRTADAVYRASKAGNTEYLKRLCAFAAAHKVGIAVENMWDLHLAPKRLYADNAEELCELVDAVDAENLGVCWDLEHASIMQQDQEKALRVIGKRLKVTHVSDQTGTDNIHVMPFQGKTDWTKAMRALAEISYEGNLNFEAQWFLNKVPEALLPASLRYSIAVGEYLIALFEEARRVYSAALSASGASGTGSGAGS